MTSHFYLDNHTVNVAASYQNKTMSIGHDSFMLIIFFLPVSLICCCVLDNGMLRNVSYKWHARQNDPSLVLNATLDNATGRSC